MTPELRQQLKQIGDLFSRAEEIIKTVEVSGSDGPIITAINQLRYVAFHLLRVCNGSDAGRQNEELKKAKYHCQRAIYDATEIGIIQHLEKIQLFQNDYRNQTIVDTVPEYLGFCGKSDNAREFISHRVYRINDSCSDNEADNLNEMSDDADEALSHFRELKEASDKLETSREEMNKKIKHRADVNFRFGVLALLTVLGIVVAIVR